MANESQKSDSLTFSEERPLSTNLTSRESLIGRLRAGTEARARFVDSHLTKGMAFQLRSLRDREEWSQVELAEKVGMTQNAISRLENPNYGKATLTTLKRIAAAFDVGLVVRYVPFSQLANWASGTPYIENGLSPDTMNVPSFEQELKQGAFEHIGRSAGDIFYQAGQLPHLDFKPGNILMIDTNELLRMNFGRGRTGQSRVSSRPADPREEQTLPSAPTPTIGSRHQPLETVTGGH